MTAILSFIQDEKRLAKWLFLYWLISPFAFFLLVYMNASHAGSSFRENLQSAPVALSFLTSCISLILAYLVHVAQGENENTLRIFAVFAVVQQLLVGNPIGFLLSFFLARALWLVPRDGFSQGVSRWVLIGGMVFIGFLTLLTAFAQVNLWLSA